MSTLVFFPWLKIDTIMKVGNFTLTPYERGKAPLGYNSVQQQTIDTILRSYIQFGEKPIDRATLLMMGSYDVLQDLSNDESNTIFAFSELLSMSALSERGYFASGINYCNRDLFRVVLQSFETLDGGITRITKRRDGTTKTFISKGKYHLHRPDHVKHPLKLEINKSLLAALVAAQNDMPTKKWMDF
jgi:hypothetical protein